MNGLTRGSWKTTIVAIGTVLTTAFTLIVQPLLDNDPNTVAQWSTALPIFVAALTGFFTRDDDKTSEDVEAKS